LKVKRVVGSKGQIVIPKRMREILGLREGTEVTIELRGNEIVIKKSKLEYFEKSYVEYYVKTHSPKLKSSVDIERLIEEEALERIGLPGL